jgi:NADH-quinone oxidoreductase subunit C
VASIVELSGYVAERFGDSIACILKNDELTVEIPSALLINLCTVLKEHDVFKFEQLIDLTCVDYLEYGVDEWSTSEQASGSGFSRGVEKKTKSNWSKPRFAVVYHFLSLTHNHRIRIKTYLEEESLIISSITDIYNNANWYEREAFDLFGILFEGHPDLRRILTDYDFIGHPFRKDFPISGHVEMRYDEKLKRIVYEPVTIEPRVLVPKTIREVKGEVND